MSDQAKNSAGPVKPAERIETLDVLRGFALLGILIPNIQAFAMISMAYRNPLAYGDWTGLNFLVWYATNLLFEAKFMTIFSILFGAGIVLMTERAAGADDLEVVLPPPVGIAPRVARVEAETGADAVERVPVAR